METWIRPSKEGGGKLLEENKIEIVDAGKIIATYDLEAILDCDPSECGRLNVGDIFNLSFENEKGKSFNSVGVKVVKVVLDLDIDKSDEQTDEQRIKQWVFVELVDLPDGFDIW